MLKFYLPDDMVTQYEQMLANPCIHDKLDTDVAPMGYIAVDKPHLAFGVLNKDLALIPSSIFTRDGRPHRPIPHAQSVDTCPYFDMDVVYCDGGRFFLFGHVLLEGLARIYPYMDSKYKNCKFVFVDIGGQPIPIYARKMLNMYGIRDEDIIVLNKSARFRNVFVPRASFDIAAYASRAFA